MEFFERLGAKIEQQWRDVNYLESAFPEISAAALAEANLVEEVDPWDLVSILHQAAVLPEQQKDEFSDLALTFYRTPRFRIDVYFWLDSTTAIHQHSFSGAFQVLAGSSIHSVYEFELLHAINTHFALGNVILTAVQTLRRADIRKIHAGQKFVHSLFHLDRPSATITVRTHQDVDTLPQYSYLKPHIAFDPFFTDFIASKKLQSVSVLLRMKAPELYDKIETLVSTSDLQTTYSVLDLAYASLIGSMRERHRAASPSGAINDLGDEKARFQSLVTRARARHGSLIDFLLPVLSQRQREQAVINSRAALTNSEHRFFLALLLNVEDRQQIFDLVRERFPNDDPLHRVCAWIDELSQANGAGAGSLLGLPPLNDVDRLVLRSLLEGQTYKNLQPRLRQHKIKVSKSDYNAVAERLQRSIIIKSVLRGSAAPAVTET